MSDNVYEYIFVMAAITYLIRVLPLLLFRNEIKSTFVKSVLYYVPYAALAAMTFPAIINEYPNQIAAAAGLLAGIVLSYFERSMFTVAIAVCVVVYVVNLLVPML